MPTARFESARKLTIAKTCIPPRKTPESSTVSLVTSSGAAAEFSHGDIPRKSMTASIACRIELYDSEKVSTTSQPLPTDSHAARKSSTATRFMKSAAHTSSSSSWYSSSYPGSSSVGPVAGSTSLTTNLSVQGMVPTGTPSSRRRQAYAVPGWPKGSEAHGTCVSSARPGTAARSSATVTEERSWSSSVLLSWKARMRCDAYRCLVHTTSYSVPTSDSGTRFDEVKRAPTCTNSGIRDSRSASSAGAAIAGAGASAAGPASSLAAAALLVASFCIFASISASMVTSSIERGRSVGAARYSLHDASSAASGTGSGSSSSDCADFPASVAPESSPVSSVTKKMARSRTSSSLSYRQRCSSTVIDGRR
mmetsp:Transcript_32101/g.105931  ORF Transcript_32101/g.105931 Transcript_32101/m.105931 type:complete len:365 (-) Transcript_32101:1657-2751(-)